MGVVARSQWKGTEGSPKLYGANVYIPIQLSRMGFGLIMMKESIGLRDIILFNASATNNVQLGDRSYLSFGYGLGLNYTSYDLDRIITTDDEYLSSDIRWTSTKGTLKLGLFYTNPHIFTGISSNGSIGSASGESWYLPGFDFVFGSMHRLSPSIFFRPDLIIKYYKTQQVIVTEQVADNSYAPAVYDLSASFLFGGRFWLSTSHRFGLAQTFSLDLNITENLQAGYTFELGLGEGLNQFNSSGVSISYRINKQKSLGGFQKEYRYDYRNQFKYLYR